MKEAQIDKMLEEFELTYIDGVPLNDPKPKAPYGFGKYEQDLDSGRDISGVMDRNVLPHHPRKLFLNFPYGMNKAQMSKLLNLVDKSTLSVKAFDPWTGDMQTVNMQMMHGDLVPQVDYFYFDYDTQKIDCKYQEFSIELVEY